MSEEKKEKSNHTPPVNIGGLLAKQRKNRNASVEMIAKTSNLSKEVIEHLENNEFSKIGAAVYVRGYLSLYAKSLGLDVAKLINLYNSQYPSEDITLRPAITQLNGKVRQERKRHSKTLSLLVSLAILAVLLYTYYRAEPVLFNKLIGKTDVVQLSGDSDNAAGNTGEITAGAAEDVNSLASDVLKGQPISGNDGLTSDVELDSIELESLLNSIAGDSDKQASESSKVSAETDKQSNANNAAASATPLLKMTFRADCWLKMTDSKGKKIIEGIYSAKRPVSVQVTLPVILKTGRPSAITSVTLSGKNIDLADYRLSKTRYEIK